MAETFGLDDFRAPKEPKPLLLPPSLAYDVDIDFIGQVGLGPVDIAALLKEDAERALIDKVLRYGVGRDIVVELGEGQWYEIPGFGHLWIVEVFAEGAMGIRLHFSDVDLPEGAQLFVYAAWDPERLAGPYSGRGPFGDGQFWTPTRFDEVLRVEYFVPLEAAEDLETPAFVIDGLQHIYRDPIGGNAGEPGEGDRPEKGGGRAAEGPPGGLRDGGCSDGGCTDTTTLYPDTLFTTSSSDWTTFATCAYAGEHSRFWVEAGLTYEWSACSGDGEASCSWDSQFMLRDTSGNNICYDDDWCSLYGPSKIRWTATFTGEVHLARMEYYCDTNTTCAALVWRRASDGDDCCGDPGTGDCFEPSGTPCCEDAACCEAVCAYDPYCCEQEWDSYCAQEASDEPACACRIDVTCYPSWEDVARACAGIGWIDSDSLWCSGQLLNTYASDWTPYWLTANHCLDSQSAAQSAEIYWLYQSSTCDGSPPPLSSVPQSAVCTLLSTGEPSDYTLLMVEGELPSGLYWAGWTSGSISDGTACTGIHHPAGTHKRISFGSKTSTTSTHHWIGWSDGGTEGGSSGSGIFKDSTQQLFGQLSGNVPDCWFEDNYGRFDVTYPNISGLLAGGSDDYLEENDTCSTSTSVGTGSYADLIVKSVDEDWYKIGVPGGGTLDIDVFFTDDFGDIDMELYDACGGSIAASSTTTSDDESISYTNPGGCADFYLRVYLWPDTRNDYAMVISVPLIGDLNCDGHVDGFDIDAFILAVLSTPPDHEEYYAEYPDCDVMLADIDCSGHVDGFDIDPFVELLTGG